jgi:hypothetical protein
VGVVKMRFSVELRLSTMVSLISHSLIQFHHIVARSLSENLYRRLLGTGFEALAGENEPGFAKSG